MQFDKTQYLRRTGLPSADIPATYDGVSRLQLAQTSRIVFENMTPLTGGVPDLSEEGLWQKLVVDGRGGYCFELNGLFAMALKAFGFDFSPFLARVRNGLPQGGARTHLGFIVTIDGENYLADCGFGGGAPVLPMRLVLDEAQKIYGEVFRLRFDGATGETVLEREVEDGWFALYGFQRVAVYPIDIEAANFLTARWEKAPFSSNLMMTIVTKAGRNNLFNRSLKVIRNGVAESRTFGTFDDFRDAMTRLFGLPDDLGLFERVWEKIKRK